MNQMQRPGRFNRVLKMGLKSQLTRVVDDLTGGFVLAGLEQQMVRSMCDYFRLMKVNHTIQNPSITVVRHNSSVTIDLCNDGAVVKPVAFHEFCSILGVMPMLAEGIPKKINQYLLSESGKLGVSSELLSLVISPNGSDIGLQLKLDQDVVKVISLQDLMQNL